NALRAQGPDYAPRTHHLDAQGHPKYINRLIRETSPYLLQHAHNPVDWWPWSDEAFAAAKAMGRPILLSVGYSTCHWCHVMERESFEDEEIAAYINSHFIAIKVDREERPDVDSVYMMAVQLMTGRGGWPMTVVMTPDGRPYFGGTYFPARDGDRGVRIGFLSILQRLFEAFRDEPEKVASSANSLSQALAKASQREPPKGMPGREVFRDACQILAKRFDPLYGGFGRPPKFPRPSTYELLLRFARRSGDPQALHIVTHSLRKMMRGGVYDHVGGGFARYSTDRQWLVPHFEKMLYDNAQLVSLLIETYQASGDSDFAEIAKETLDYVLREMTSPEGGFYSATDADSEGEEGKFFVWTLAELDTILGPDASKIVQAYFDVTNDGNFEGHSILHRPRTDAEIAQQLNIEVDALRQQIEKAKSTLYAARKKRIAPLLDDKIITEWNGQMISALARAGFALDDSKYISSAKKAADFILGAVSHEGRLRRAYRKGQARHAAVLEDYAFFIAGLLDLYEATSEQRWLQEAIRLQTIVDTHFLDADNGGYFATADDSPKLLVREKPIYDGAQPSGNSVSALNLLRLHTLTTDDKYRALAERVIFALGQTLLDGAVETPKLATALDFYYDEAKEIAVVGEGPERQALLDVLRKSFLPNRALSLHPTPEVPWTEDKRPMGGKPTAYVCLNQVCKKPTSDPKELERQLAEIARIEAEPLPISSQK
ncbi:MAG: thioredoxin domain-containing protein, partial [Myxococcota bacterium]